MKKKQKKKQTFEFIDELIEQLKMKNQQYSSYLTDEFYMHVYNQLTKIDDLSPSTCSEKMDNLVNKELTRLIREGNIDLEIQLIEENRSKVAFFMKKMGITGPDFHHVVEDYIMKAIESYQGEQLFSLYVIQCIKENLHRKNTSNQTEIKKEVIEEKKHENISSLKNEETNIVINQEKQDSKNLQSFSSLVNQYIKDEKIKKDKPTILENMFQTLVNLSSFDQEKEFLQFIYLKYGYHDGFFFSLEDIGKMLNLNEQDLSSYYIESLTLLKKAINQAMSFVLEFEDVPYRKK